MAQTITSADASVQITVENLYPTGFAMSGFAADNIFDAENVELAQTVRGADGKLSAGFVFGDITQTFHIMPDSPIYSKIQTWINTTVASKAVYRCNATALFKSNGRKYTCTNGVLVNAGLIPAAGRILQPITMQIKWEVVSASDV